MSSHLLLPSLFFFFFSPLTRPHEVEEWQPLPISAAVSAGIGLSRWPFWPYQFPFPPEFGRVGTNQKKKRGGESVSQTPDVASDSDAATLEPRWCFLDSKSTEK